MKNPVPPHVAIIPDGNRRWAATMGLRTIEGHRRGIESFRGIAYHAIDKGVRCISIWGMSIDNLIRRNPGEVRGLLRLFRDEAIRMIHDQDIHTRQVKVQILGRWREKFPRSVCRAFEAVEEATHQYSQNMLNFLLAYNGTDEMLQAVQQIAHDVRRRNVKRITEQTVKQYLYTKDVPPVDLVIRTGGEPHLSNGFMMWDIANAELHFSDKFWPAFSTADFDRALMDFASRRRKLGS